MTNVMEANIRAAPKGDASNSTAVTRFIETKLETYAYRRLGGGATPPLVFLQHFTGTLDNWDPAVTDAVAQGRARAVNQGENAGAGGRGLRILSRVPMPALCRRQRVQAGLGRLPVSASRFIGGSSTGDAENCGASMLASRHNGLARQARVETSVRMSLGHGRIGTV
jgi:hypothetical protein